jgi:hypothetical protein
MVDAQEEGVVLGTVASDGSIIAVDSDFLFMEIKPTSLPAEANAGLGVFAKVDIGPQEILCEYRGATVPVDVPIASDDIYTTRTSLNELLSIVPQGDRPICAYINDCVVASPEAYTGEELDTIERGEAQLKVYPGFAHNSAALITRMGKVFVVSTRAIPAGSEIFFAYGNSYWLARLRSQERDEAWLMAEVLRRQTNQPAAATMALI